MGDRGRKSGLPDTTGTTAVCKYPGPPVELTSEQAGEWKAIVTRLPADWFPRETWAMLAQYCRHVVSARHVAQLIAQFQEALSAVSINTTNPVDEDDEEGENDKFSLKSYDKLLGMQEREGRAMSSLATRMRLTQQSTYDKEKKKPKQAERPWEV